MKTDFSPHWILLTTGIDLLHSQRKGAWHSCKESLPNNFAYTDNALLSVYTC